MFIRNFRLIMLKKSSIIKTFLLLLITSIITSCEWINPDENIPSFIKIEAINVSTLSEQGTSSHKITDAWVYLDEEVLGAYELPATIPILQTGNKRISIRPGIQLNGIAATRASYPFYNPIVMNVDLEADHITNLGTLTTTYNTATKFSWIEDFEQGGISIVRTSRSDTTLSKTSSPDKVFEGSWSGLINLDDVRKTFEAASNSAFVLPGGESPVFLEMNFKTNTLLTIGLFINQTFQTIQHPILVLNKTDKWTKIYVNLTPTVSRETAAIDFKVFIGAIKEDEVSAPEILIDNIKLIHF